MLLGHEKGEETVGKPSLTSASALKWVKEPLQTGSPAVNSILSFTSYEWAGELGRGRKDLLRRRLNVQSG